MDDNTHALWYSNVGGNISNVWYGFDISHNLYKQVPRSNTWYIWGFSYLYPLFSTRLNPAPEMKLSDLIMFCVGSLIDDCQGKSFWHIKSAKMRVFMLTYLLGTLVITCGYRSALFSMLTAPLVSWCHLHSLFEWNQGMIITFLTGS